MNTLNVEIIGQEKGSDLVLIHGWGMGSAVWQPVLSALSAQFRVHLVSLPGYGLPEDRMDKQPSHAHGQQAHEQTASEPTHCTTPFDALSSLPSDKTPAFIQTAEALAAALPEGCILCGWSLGALLALQAALLAAQRVRGLILIGGTPSFTQRDDWRHAQPPTLLDTFSDAVASDGAGTLQRFVALLNQGDAQARTISRAMTRSLLAARLPDTATLLAGLGWLRAVDLRPQVASIAAPTLLIHGEHDPLMPLPAAQWLNEKLPRSQLELFTGAAHAPFLNDPVRFARLIGDFCHASALN